VDRFSPHEQRDDVTLIVARCLERPEENGSVDEGV
jgi:hypothetical protein